MNEFFRKFAHASATAVGTPFAFLLGVLVIVVWGITGPAFHYSDTWQLVINTGTTIVTFLMVFLIQNTQNRDAKAMHLKLDELIRSVASARNRLVHLEDLSDADLAKLEEEFRKLHEKVEKKFEEQQKKEE
jgi:low affinity Fe/Cu permease